MIGQTLAHYRITEKLGEGGMGTVYRAEDQRLGREVALKFVLSSLGADLNGRERLMREAKACAALNHPNITTIYDLGEDGERSFIVMEFVDGVTLQEAVRERKFSTEKIVSIGTQIADALGAAHERGIVHRDLKSANIMLDANGRVKVMDFGLAKLAESSFLTQSGATLGTAAYMSPEQVRGDELTAASDIYSLGVVLYEMATGVTPYSHAHQLAVMYAVANEQPMSPRERNPEVPEALEAVIMRAMAKAPDERFASCGELAEALLEVSPAAGRAARLGTVVSARSSGRMPGDGKTNSDGHVATGGEVGASALQRVMRRRWFRVGAPVTAIAGALALVLLAYGGSLSGNAESTTASGYYEIGIEQWNAAQQHEARAEASEAQARYREAREALQRSIELDGGSSSVWSLLAGVSARLNQYEQAVGQNERAIELDAANTEAHYNLGYALEEMGDRERAITAYSKAIEHDSSFTEAYSALGNLLIDLERPEEALAILERALEKTPDSPAIFLVQKNIGKAHLIAGRPERAIPYLAESRVANPEWPETHALLARAYEGTGQDEDAEILWQRYIELETDPQALTAARERLQK